jgi:four helix bundle protein
MKDFRSLKVWEKAHQFALMVYRLTKSFPREEQYGLTSQLRRAAASVPTNIAEGCGRGSDPDFARFLQVALGSACECDYLLLLSRDLEYVSLDAHVELYESVSEVKRMLTGLIQTLRL